MDRLVRDDRKTTVTQIITRYNQDLQNTISEHTTRRTLTQMDSSSRRPHRVPLRSDKNSTRRIQFTQDHQNWTIEDCKNVVWSDESDFCCNIQMIGSESWVKNMKLRQFWRQKGVKPRTSKVYLIKWPVSVCMYIYLYVYISSKSENVFT